MSLWKKIAQNVAQRIFVKITTQLIPWIEVAQNVHRGLFSNKNLDARCFYLNMSSKRSKNQLSQSTQDTAFFNSRGEGS
jgi:hypothetical protein